MSTKITKRVWGQSSLVSYEKFVLIALADVADSDGFCWVSYAKIEEMTGINPRQLMKVIGRIKDANELMVWEQQGQHGGRGYTNIYLVTIGLTTEQITEVITRRFDLMPDEVEPVISKKGDIYTTLCHLKRVSKDTLLRTRKGDTSTTDNTQKGDRYDTHNEKRVIDMTEKGDTSITRTINNHVSNKHINNNARAKFAEYFTNNYGSKHLEATITLMQYHAVETKALIPENLKTFKRWGDNAYQILRLVDFDLGKAKPLVTKCIEINRDGGYGYSEPKSILTTFRNELVAEQDGVSNNGRNPRSTSRAGPQTARTSPADTAGQAAGSRDPPERGRAGLLSGSGKR